MSEEASFVSDKRTFAFGKWCRLCRGQKQVTGDMADSFWTEFEEQMLKAQSPHG